MNLLTCNMRPSFAPGMLSRNVPHKMQFHHAAAPSLENLIQSNNTSAQNSDKHFQNPNIFNQNVFEKSIPSCYKHSNHPVDKVLEKSVLNCCVLILEEAKQTDSDSMLIKESPKSPVENICQNNSKPKSEFTESPVAPSHMDPYKFVSDEEMSCSDSDNDSFIIFENVAGPSRKPSRESPIVEFINEYDSSSDDDDDDWCQETLVFQNSNQNRNRESSICESEDSFIVFDDGDPEEDSDEMEKCGNDTFIVFEDSEEDMDEEKEMKSDNGKKVSFAEGAELCTVHLMVKWSFAYKKARKGLWEQIGRDNERFRNRADLFGMQLNKFLQPQHRQKIYEERFKDRPE